MIHINIREKTETIILIAFKKTELKKKQKNSIFFLIL